MASSVANGPAVAEASASFAEQDIANACACVGDAPTQSVENVAAWSRFDRKGLVAAFAGHLEKFAGAYIPYLDATASPTPRRAPFPLDLTEPLLDASLLLQWTHISDLVAICLHSPPNRQWAAFFPDGRAPPLRPPAKMISELALDLFRAGFPVLRRTIGVFSDVDRMMNWGGEEEPFGNAAYEAAFTVPAILAAHVLFELAMASAPVRKRLSDDPELLIALMRGSTAACRGGWDACQELLDGWSAVTILKPFTYGLVLVLGESTKAYKSYMTGAAGVVMAILSSDMVHVFFQGLRKEGNLIVDGFVVYHMLKPGQAARDFETVKAAGRGKNLGKLDDVIASYRKAFAKPRGAVRDACDHCGANGKIKRCSRCGVARYCGAECQRAAWKEHKKAPRGPFGASVSAAMSVAPTIVPRRRHPTMPPRAAQKSSVHGQASSPVPAAASGGAAVAAADAHARARESPENVAAYSKLDREATISCFARHMDAFKMAQDHLHLACVAEFFASNLSDSAVARYSASGLVQDFFPGGSVPRHATPAALRADLAFAMFKKCYRALRPAIIRRGPFAPHSLRQSCMPAPPAPGASLDDLYFRGLWYDLLASVVHLEMRLASAVDGMRPSIDPPRDFPGVPLITTTRWLAEAITDPRHVPGAPPPPHLAAAVQNLWASSRAALGWLDPELDPPVPHRVRDAFAGVLGLFDVYSLSDILLVNSYFAFKTGEFRRWIRAEAGLSLLDLIVAAAFDSAFLPAALAAVLAVENLATSYAPVRKRMGDDPDLLASFPAPRAGAAVLISTRRHPVRGFG
ncbi:hypothetical protein DFJ74DRAFT_756909, partial [Hyaloraphidium curvatum]